MNDDKNIQSLNKMIIDVVIHNRSFIPSVLKMRYTREDVITFVALPQILCLIILFLIGDISAFKTFNIVCDSHDAIDECTIDGVNIITGKYQLNIFAEQPGLVKTLRCHQDSDMRLHTLNEDICRQFPNLKELSLPTAKIRRITRGAFIHCHQLETLRLYGNDLKWFPWTAFQWRKGRPVVIKTLSFIDLQKNNLTDFRIEKFMKLFPRLYMVNLDENPIPDERMDEITTQLDVLYFDSTRNT